MTNYRVVTNGLTFRIQRERKSWWRCKTYWTIVGYSFGYDNWAPLEFNTKEEAEQEIRYRGDQEYATVVKERFEKAPWVPA